ncbi:hypothetical protein QU42_31725 [Bradyrhizobium sp. UASWS1016]|nr:hypothetical protein QU41_08050 [Bradyrhizobium elkanii]OCX27269.1 hypothetical protein QU42_31725 [Bradyrhizobium sp. UASWS1016]
MPSSLRAVAFQKCFELMLRFACGALTQAEHAAFMSHSAGNTKFGDSGRGFCNDLPGRIGK